MYHDDKEISLEIFKLKLANCLNFINKGLFAKIFSYSLVTLTNKLINTTNKEQNKIIVKDIEKNRRILYENDNFNNWTIQPNARSVDLIDAIKIILRFNEKIQ